MAPDRATLDGTATPAQHARVFRGWLVVAGAFAVMFLGFGCAYTFGTFVDPLQRAFGASRGAVSVVFSVAGFLYFGLGIVSGPAADRWGARPVAIAGMVVLALGLAAAAYARSLVEVMLAYGLGVGLGVGLSYVPAIAAVQRWFQRRRAMASGIAVSGIGIGTLAMPALASALIGALGWRNAYVALAAISLVLGVGFALLIESDPARRGLGVDGAPTGTAADAPAQGMERRQAVRSRAFALLYAACLACAFGVFVPFVHLVPYARDHGIADGSAALLLGGIGLGSTAGRFVLGGVADRFGRQRSLVGIYLAMAAAMFGWAASESLWALAPFAVAYGLFYGGWVALLPSLVMDFFGGRHVSGITGALYTSAALGTLIGPSAAGFAFDRTGSYTLTILLAAALNLLAAAITWRVRKPEAAR